MKCYKCGGDLRVTHTFSGEHQKTQRLKCSACGLVHTAVTLVEVETPGRSALKLRPPRMGGPQESPQQPSAGDG